MDLNPEGWYPKRATFPANPSTFLHLVFQFNAIYWLKSVVIAEN